MERYVAICISFLVLKKRPYAYNDNVENSYEGDWGGFMYKKCISYMYEYEYGRKGDNVGFAKVEIQNQYAKLQIQLQGIKKDGKWSVFSFQRNGEEIKTAPLGNGTVTEGNGKFELEEQTAKLWQQGTFLIQGFLLLPDGVGRKDAKAYVCMSKWDDGEVIWDRIDLLREKTTEQTQEKESDLAQKEILENGQEFVEKAAVQGQQLECEQEGDAKGEDIEGEDREAEECAVIRIEAIHKDCQEADIIEPMEEVQNTWESPRDEMEKNFSKEEKAKCENLQERGEKEKEEAEKEKEEAGCLKKNIEEQLALEEEQQRYSWEAFEKRRKEMCSQLQEMKEKDEKEDQDEMNQKKEDEPEKRKEKDGNWEVGEQFLRGGMGMNPFYDTDVSAAVRMEPRDLGKLPIEFWYLANNSFLLHGYYSYRHLLFMKIRNREEWQYAIGVPGKEKEQEKFMANMFGFQHFKKVNRKEDEKFGYWWLRLM